MNKIKILSNSENDTKNFAKQLAKELNKGDIVILSGDLGVGKTKFVEGFLSNFNLEDEISSPTFNIVNEYQKDDVIIYHFDVYRLQDSSEFYELGGEEFFDNGICLIEWGEIIEDAIPDSHITVLFERDSNLENTRILNIFSYGENYDIILEKLKEANFENFSN